MLAGFFGQHDACCYRTLCGGWIVMRDAGISARARRIDDHQRWLFRHLAMGLSSAVQRVLVSPRACMPPPAEGVACEMCRKERVPSSLRRSGVEQPSTRGVLCSGAARVLLTVVLAGLECFRAQNPSIHAAVAAGSWLTTGVLLDTTRPVYQKVRDSIVFEINICGLQSVFCP